jgi:hypothetical protein
MSKISNEFIYEQWRNFLCNDALNNDISSLNQANTELTVEEIRAIFNYGYKFAMAQTKDSLQSEIKDAKDNETRDLLFKLIDKINARVSISDCLNIYRRSSSLDDKHLEIYHKTRDRKKQIELLLGGQYGNACSWASDEKM